MNKKILFALIGVTAIGLSGCVVYDPEAGYWDPVVNDTVFVGDVYGNPPPVIIHESHPVIVHEPPHPIFVHQPPRHDVAHKPPHHAPAPKDLKPPRVHHDARPNPQGNVRPNVAGHKPGMNRPQAEAPQPRKMSQPPQREPHRAEAPQRNADSRLPEQRQGQRSRPGKR